MVILIALAIVLVCAVVLSGAWAGFLIVWAGVFMTVALHTDNHVLAIFAAAAACVALYCVSRWLHNWRGTR